MGNLCVQSKQPPQSVILGRTARNHRLLAGTEEKDTNSVTGLGLCNSKHRLEEEEFPQLDENGRLVAEEVEQRRTFTETKTTTFRIGGGKTIRLRYASCTQRGYYPDDPSKHNQDAISITQTFAGEEGDLFFGVYDGHGSEGHECANYAREHLPKLLSKHLRQERANLYKEQRQKDRAQSSASTLPYNPKLWPMLDAEVYQRACQRAHLDCNRNMFEDLHKVQLSGTTAISAGFHNGQFTISNVGDSRAVLGYREHDTPTIINGTSEWRSSSDHDWEEKKDHLDPILQDRSTHQQHHPKLIAIPLSIDQTPWRKDERNRIKVAGGRVLTVDQVEGRKGIPDESTSEGEFGDRILGANDDAVDLEGDPPRVWLPDKPIPGTAYSRSLGDYIAQTVGVFAEPETCTKDFTTIMASHGDEVLVLASDGVFEFLTNQDVVDICDQVWNDGGCVMDACREIMDKSYEKWTQYENRTDDISVIVIRMDAVSC